MSSDNVKAIRAPARMPGIMRGKVTCRNVWSSLAPRSWRPPPGAGHAGSRARTTTVTKEILKAMCEIMTVVSLA